MGKITFNGKSYDLKYTIESWKKLKESNGITPMNFQQKLEEDMAGCLSALIYYGISKKERADIDIDDLDEKCTFKELDLVSSAILSTLPSVAKVVKKDGTDIEAPQAEELEEEPESGGGKESGKK